MESYVVRIYRREKKNPDSIAGIVELIDAQEKKAFTSLDDLRRILSMKISKKDVKKPGHAGGK